MAEIQAPTKPDFSVDMGKFAEKLQTNKEVIKDESTTTQKPIETKTEVLNEQLKEQTTEAKTEVKTEATTEVKTDAKPDEVTLDQADQDYLNSLLDDKKEDAPKEEPKTTEPKEPATDYSKEVAEYTSIMQDPLLSALVKMRLSGELNDISEIGDKIGVGPDPKKMTEDQVYKTYLQSEGITGDDLNNAMEEFSEKAPHEKKLLVKPMIKELDQLRGEKLKSFTVQSDPEKARIEAEAKALQSAAETKAMQRLTHLKENTVGNKYKGLQVTAEMWDQILPDVYKYAEPVLDNSGKISHYDVDEAISLSLWKRFGDKLLKANKHEGAYEATLRYYKERTRPAKDDVRSDGPAPNNPLKAAAEAAREGQRARRN